MGADQSTRRRNQVRQGTRNGNDFFDTLPPSGQGSSHPHWSDTRPSGEPALDSRPNTRGTLVVVKPALQKIDIENDPVSVRLRSVPSFNPIFMNKDKLAWTKEGERARQKIDPSPLLNIGLLFQTHVRKEATIISRKQNELSRQIKTVDQSTGRMIKGYTDRQRKSAKHAEEFNKINGFAHILAKCQAVLNDCKRMSIILNEMLPEDDRLEPFVWAEDRELTEMPKMK